MVPVLDKTRLALTCITRKEVLMSHQLQQRELIIDLSSGDHDIQRVTDPRIVGPIDYGWVRHTENPEAFTWGGGPLAGSRIPGSRRLFFCAYSPTWEGFYISSLGGGAYVMHRVGVDFFCLSGVAPEDSVLILNHSQGQISVRLEPINADVLWTGYADPQGRPLVGFYALQQAVFDRYSAEYNGDWVRVFAVGPAARRTREGVIGSNHVKDGLITPVDDWAGRGGLGSRLLQKHRIAACIFGGDWEDPDLKNSVEIDGYFLIHYGDRMIKVDLGATEKYRYVPGFRTGGTFGVNMLQADERLFSFNYQSTYASHEARLNQHQAFILDHYLRQFNQEIIEARNFKHCGEPCAVACKKMDRHFKKDYEPYQALGPLCGVFDQRAAEELNYYVDAMGFDTIQTGGTVSWVMELVHRGLIPPEELGLPPASAMRFDFTNGADDFDVVADSARNAAYARAVVDAILFGQAGGVLRQGLRAAAKALDARYGLTEPGQRTIDYAVFTAHGDEGCMIPNQYWVPGMFSPMPMMGKYFNYYGVDFLPPRELGRKCVERMVYEFYSDNSGICRFHRKWAEAIVDEIIACHYDLPLDYKTHQFSLAKAICEQEIEGVVFWESERTVDIILGYLESWEQLKSPALAQWLERFRADKWRAARDYWGEVHAGIVEALSAGTELLPDKHPEHKAAVIDVMEKRT
jgi:glyceraldehyde-3-phosphate dehydrogenase (ferredoxin)